MEIKKRGVAELTQDPRNARSHDGKNIEAIKRSLEEFGQQKPIVVNTGGKVVAGNGTLAAAVDLGWDKIAVVETDLVGSSAAAYAIADNRTAELAAWDYPTLGEVVQELLDDGYDPNTFGWSEHEIEPLLLAEWASPDIEPLDDALTENVKTIKLNKQQWETISIAIEKVKERTKELDDSGCLEIICAEWAM